MDDKKVILITGAVSGIGLAGVRAYGKLGWKVLVHARSGERGAGILDSLKTDIPEGDFHLVTGDLADLSQVKSLADRVKILAPALDVLWNNAGVMMNQEKVTLDGFEYQWGVNHLASFLLTRELCPLIQKARQGRIIFTSSLIHRMGRLPEKGGFFPLGGKYLGLQRYSDTKLANVLLTQELARRLKETKITIHAFHPGQVKSGIGTNGVPEKQFSSALLGFFQISPEAGADTGVFLGTSEQPGLCSGLYWTRKKVRRNTKLATEMNGNLLWSWSEDALAKFL